MYIPVLSTMAAAALNERDTPPHQSSPLPRSSSKKLIIRYESKGSFHQWSYRFVFTSREVVIYDLGAPGRTGIPHKVGSHHLSTRELARMNQIFHYYSEQTKSRRPVVDIIRFTERDENGQVRSTTYVDASGRTLDQTEMLHLRHMPPPAISRVDGRGGAAFPFGD